MLDKLRGALVPIGFVVSTIDRSLAAGSFHNARQAAADSALRRSVWGGVVTAKNEDRKDRTVA